MVQDLATQWIQAYPCKNKTSQETQRSLQKFLEPERKPKVIYTDNSLEFGKACEDLSWNHCTSTPHRLETNGIAERAVRRVKEGTSAVLLQSGLNESWWADSMECYTYLRNVTDLPYERRFGQPFKGPSISFGSSVEYHPITAKDQSRIHQFGKKVLPGLFLGYALYAGGIWKGDVLVADFEELDRKLLKKTRCKRGDISQRKRRIYFSNRRWTNQNTWRGSGTENIHLDTASTNSRWESHWLSWRIRRVSSTTSWRTSGCRWSDKRLLVHCGKLHIPPSRWTQSQTLLAPREESFPIPLKYIDVSRTTHTNLDVKQEKRIDDYWNIDGSIDLSESFLDMFHSVYSVMWETSSWIHVVRERDWQNGKQHPGQITYGQNSGEERQGICFIGLEDKEFIETIRNTTKIGNTSGSRHALQDLQEKASMGRPVARIMISSLNLRVSWKPVNPQGCVCKNLYQVIMRTILQKRRQFTATLQFGTQIYSYVSSYEDACSESSSGLRMGETWKDFGVGPDKNQKQIRGSINMI